jgi:hypothetical protein
MLRWLARRPITPEFHIAASPGTCFARPRIISACRRQVSSRRRCDRECVRLPWTVPSCAWSTMLPCSTASSQPCGGRVNAVSESTKAQTRSPPDRACQSPRQTRRASCGGCTPAAPASGAAARWNTPDTAAAGGCRSGPAEGPGHRSRPRSRSRRCPDAARGRAASRRPPGSSWRRRAPDRAGALPAIGPRPRPLQTARPVVRQSTSKMPAAPMPPPMHMVTQTRLAPRRLPSISAWPVSRCPLTP